jgi:hypothetical protein
MELVRVRIKNGNKYRRKNMGRTLAEASDNVEILEDEPTHRPDGTPLPETTDSGRPRRPRRPSMSKRRRRRRPLGPPPPKEGVGPMSIVFPEATKVQGNTSVYVVQTVANMAAPDLSSEINAGSSVIVSCYLYGDLNPTVTTNKGEAPRRLCTTQVFQQFGNTTYEVPDLQYVYDPQAATSTTTTRRSRR